MIDCYVQLQQQQQQLQAPDAARCWPSVVEAAGRCVSEWQDGRVYTQCRLHAACLTLEAETLATRCMSVVMMTKLSLNRATHCLVVITTDQRNYSYNCCGDRLQWRSQRVFMKSSNLVYMHHVQLEMHDKIYHFEIFKKIHGNFEIFQDPFFEIFCEIFNFHYKVT